MLYDKDVYDVLLRYPSRIVKIKTCQYFKLSDDGQGIFACSFSLYLPRHWIPHSCNSLVCSMQYAVCRVADKCGSVVLALAEHFGNGRKYFAILSPMQFNQGLRTF